jgi:hypothetical protein
MTQAALVPSPSARSRFDAGSFVTFRKDLIAGATVAAISLPQSMAYALIAGVDPRFGLYTAIVFTAVAGVFGSSRHLVNGPTGPFRWSSSARSPSSTPKPNSTPMRPCSCSRSWSASCRSSSPSRGSGT